MAISTILLFTIIMVSMNGITNSQLQIEVSKVPDIITTLLENITDTSTTTSMFLPHLASLLKNQEDVQRLTNLILQNKTDMCAAEDLTSILHEIFEDQQVNNNETTDLMRNYTNTLTGMANVLVQMANTQRDTKDTLDQMVNTQTQIANTQTQIANALTQVVNLLQTQNEQLPNTMATTTYMDEQLSTQNLKATTTYMDEQLSTQNPIIPLQPNDIIDCSDIASRGTLTSGSYTIQPWDNLDSFRVYCDMNTDDGGWTVFQKRFDGSVDFYRGWDAYEDGFGSPDGEYWLGLRQLYRMTGQGNWTLRIDLEDFETNTAFAEYRSFSVGDAADHYSLSIGAYSGTAVDSLTRHNNEAFTTKDSDHDIHSANCAQHSQGAWWYNNCASSNLNGLYLGASQSSLKGMFWYHWKHSFEVLKRSEMKIRRTQ